MGNNIVMILLMIIGGSAGIFSTLFILISLPVTIIQKFTLKSIYGYKLTDKLILLNHLPYKNNDRKIPENLTVVVFRFILLLFFLPVQVLSVLPEWR